MPGAKQVTLLDDGRLGFTFSQSWLNEYATCPERARRSFLDPEPSPPTDATAIGTALHAYIEHVLCGEAGDPFDHAAEVFRAETLLPGYRWVKVKTEGTALRYITNACDAWAQYVYPELSIPTGIESKFTITVYEDDEMVIRLKGTADFNDGELHDWKTASSGMPYDKNEKQRWAIQPTVYTLAAHMGALDADPSRFNYWVMFKDKFMAPQFVPVTRGPEDWAWLVAKCYAIASQIANEGTDRPWPMLDGHWLCSVKWCDHFDACRGSATQVFLNQVKGGLSSSHT